MRTMRRLILVIGLALTVSSLSGCATPTTPAFPEIKCQKVELSSEQLKELSKCKVGMVCSIKQSTLKRIFDIVQKNAECLIQYKAGASKFKG